MVRIRCPNVLCLYEWNYRGTLRFYATCPNCRKNIRICEHMVPEHVAIGDPIS